MSPENLTDSLREMLYASHVHSTCFTTPRKKRNDLRKTASEPTQQNAKPLTEHPPAPPPPPLRHLLNE